MIKKIFPFADFLYILQLEEYYYDRYFKRILSLFFRRDFMIHEKLVLTSRIQLTYILSVILTLYVPILLGLLSLLIWSNWMIAGLVCLGFLILSIIFIPIWVGLSSLMLEPFYSLIKKNLQNKAKRLVNETGTKNIMIVGSYGKTTTKNFIQQLIQYNYKAQMVAGNINTPTGIAVWLMKNLNKNTDVLIAETDGYKLGEIADCCKIISPDFVIITAIGDQHLERLGSKKRLAETLLEAIKYSKKNAPIILTKKTKEDFISLGLDIFKMYGENRFLILLDEGELEYNSEKVSVENLSDINKYNARFALKICELLNIPYEYVTDEMNKLKLPERRSQEIVKNGFTTLDNSYNISFDTAKAGVIEAIKKAKTQGKKLIIITAGIPELGKENITANQDYGKFLFENNISKIILLKTNLASEIQKGLDSSQVKLADSMANAWEIIIKDFATDEYLVLMQPELNDLYYIDTNFSTISVE